MSNHGASRHGYALSSDRGVASAGGFSLADFRSRVRSLAALGYLCLDVPGWQGSALLMGPGGLYAIAAHDGPQGFPADGLSPGWAGTLAFAQDLASDCRRLVGPDITVQPLLCLLGGHVSGHGTYDGVEVVSFTRLRAWLILRPELSSLSNVALLQRRISRRSGAHLPPADSAA